VWILDHSCSFACRRNTRIWSYPAPKVSAAFTPPTLPRQWAIIVLKTHVGIFFTWPFEFSVSRKVKVGQGISEGGAIPTFPHTLVYSSGAVGIAPPSELPCPTLPCNAWNWNVQYGIRKILRPRNSLLISLAFEHAFAYACRFFNVVKSTLTVWWIFWLFEFSVYTVLQWISVVRYGKFERPWNLLYWNFVGQNYGSSWLVVANTSMGFQRM
jgi:hypothetical protein